MPYTFTTEEIRKKFYSLPEVVKDVILDLDQPDTLYAIAKNNALRVDQMDDFFRIIKHSSIGLIPYNKVGDELAGVLKISPESAQKISKEVDGAVFSKIRNAFKTQSISTPQNKELSASLPPAFKRFSPPLSTTESPRPPMTPFINTGKLVSRFEPWKRENAPQTTNKETPKMSVPNYSIINKNHTPTPSQNISTPIPTPTTNQTPTIQPKNVPIPPKPIPPTFGGSQIVQKTFAQPNTSIPQGPKLVPPGQEIQPVPKPPSPVENDIQARIGQEISSSKTGNSPRAVPPPPINMTNKIPMPPYNNAGLQRGKFGQGFMPATNFTNKPPQNVSAMPKPVATEAVPPVIQKTPTPQNPKAGTVFKTESKDTVYKVDPYREPV